VLLALLIVSSAVLASPGVGTVAAVHDCSNTDAAVYGFSFGHVNEDKCTNNHVDHAVEQVRQAEESQSKVDIYTSLTAQKSRSQTFGAVYGNYLSDSESVAWMKAEAAIAEVYEQGGTKAEAKTEAKNAIADYYAVKQVNVIEDWNATASSAIYLNERSYQEDFSSEYISLKYSNSGSNVTESVLSGDGYGTYTLANGSTKSYRLVYINQNWEYGPYDGVTVTGEFYGIQAKPPNSNYGPAFFGNKTEYEAKLDRIDTKQSNLNSEVDAYVDATWQDYQDGKINSSDVLSRTTTMFEYGSQAQDGSYYDVIGASAAMGLATPDLNETGQMTITDGGGTTHQGMLFARNPPNNQWVVGKTYNPDNISGPVQFATTDGEMMELSRPFTVESAVDKEGNSRDSVGTTRYNYQTADTSETTDKYQELLGLTEDLQQRSESVDSNGGGGSSGGGTLPGWLTQSFFGIPVWALVALFLFVLVIFGGGS